MKIYFVNAFAKEEFKGNPAAIMYLNEEKEEKWMKMLAKQLNQPITTFVLKHGETFELRWFTPAGEISLCGHGTMGASHILWNEGYCDSKELIKFESLSGTLTAEKCEDKIKLSFPLIESTEIKVLDEMEKILKVPIKTMAWAKDRFIAEVENQELVYQVRPDFKLLSEMEAAGVIVTSCGVEEYDFISRYFAPKIGVNEDAVTGSAHCALASFWNKKLNKSEFSAFQASERSGELLLTVNEGMVEITGDCRTIIKGNFVKELD